MSMTLQINNTTLCWAIFNLIDFSLMFVKKEEKETEKINKYLQETKYITFF